MFVSCFSHFFVHPLLEKSASSLGSHHHLILFSSFPPPLPSSFHSSFSIQTTLRTRECGVQWKLSVQQYLSNPTRKGLKGSRKETMPSSWNQFPLNTKSSETVISSRLEVYWTRRGTGSQPLLTPPTEGFSRKRFLICRSQVNYRNSRPSGGSTGSSLKESHVHLTRRILRWNSTSETWEVCSSYFSWGQELEWSLSSSSSSGKQRKSLDMRGYFYSFFIHELLLLLLLLLSISFFITFLFPWSLCASHHVLSWFQVTFSWTKKFCPPKKLLNMPCICSLFAWIKFLSDFCSVVVVKQM